MATPASIIAAIDAAVEAQVAFPYSVAGVGRTITFRNLDDMLKTREFYAGLLRTSSQALGPRFTPIKNGGPTL